MARTLTKPKPIRDEFLQQLIGVVSTPSSSNKSIDLTEWIEPPVSLREFCYKWIGEPMFPIQQEFGDAIVGTNPYEFSTEYDEGHAFWGKGSGKDRMNAKILAYVAYKLTNLKNPQKFLREKYNASIGDDDNIDLTNMSINARQAQNVFFKKFKLPT